MNAPEGVGSLNQNAKWRGLRIAGMALCFAWVYAAFPTVQIGSAFPGGEGVWSPWLRLAAVGPLTGIALPFFSRYLATWPARRLLVVAGTAVQLLGCAVALLTPAPSGALGLALLSQALMGAGATAPLIFWGVLLGEYDADENEPTFVLTFALAGVLAAVVGIAPSLLSAGLLFALPALSCACFVGSTYDPALAVDRGASGTVSGDCAQGVLSQGFDDGVRRRFAGVLIRTFTGFFLVAFVWEVFASSQHVLLFWETAAFGLGLLVAALVVWLFTKYSPNVGFASAARCVLPIMAVGLLCMVVQTGASLTAACVLLACAHASFEMVLRMRVLGFSRSAGGDPVRTVGWGYAAIMLAAFLAPTVFHLAVPDGAAIDPLLICAILAALVVIGVFLFPVPSPGAHAGGGGDDVPNELERRANRLAAQYALSPREREVLGHLLEGRSHPYIRDQLYISKSTVDTHVHHIYAKTGVKSKQGLIDLSKQG